MRVVILVPRRSDGGRRDELWNFTKTWLMKHHGDWEIVEGDAPEGPFNRGAAINNAARQAGDWDYAVITDGDNIVHPEDLNKALELAKTTGLMTYPHDAYFYLDRESSDRITNGDMWFVQPQIYNVRPGYTPFLIHKHISGIQVVPRSVWDATGGFVELQGWGSEDSMFAILCNTFGGGVEWVRHAACYHLHHDHNKADASEEDRKRNRGHLLNLKRLERRQSPRELRTYLLSLGHTVP